MKQLLISIGISLPLLCAPLAIAQDTATEASHEASSEASGLSGWYPHDEALVLAEEHQRPIMLYYHSENCTFCDHMNMFVLGTSPVDELLAKHFVVASIDTSSDEGYRLQRQYRARGTPTFVFLALEDGAWREQGRLFGSRPRKEFAEEVLTICGEICLEHSQP